MPRFDFHWPTRFVFGQGTIERTGAEAAGAGRKALLVTGMGSAEATGILGRVSRSLEETGVQFVRFGGITPNPRAEQVDEAGRKAVEEGCDFVIGLGGGSVMDAAKAVAVAASHDGGIWEYMSSFPVYSEITDRTLPVIEIPTVSGTGSEGNGTAVISNSRTLEKSFIKSPFIFPVAAIIDPEAVLTVPPAVTASSGADIVCHVLEPYINGAGSFEASLLMTEAFIKTVVGMLGKAVEDGSDMDARNSLAWVSTLACSPFRGLGLGGSGSLHHIEHSLSGRFDVSHGEGLCALLPSWLDFMSGVAPGRVERFGASVFGEKDAAGAVRKWLGSIGADYNLQGLGAGPGDVKNLVEDTIRVYGMGDDFIRNGAFRLYAADIEKIYLGAL